MSTRSIEGRGFLDALRLERDKVASFDDYPFSIPAVRALDELTLDPKVTFLVGDNGTGKSTLIEAIAVAGGFNAEGGTKNFKFATRSSESPLCQVVRVSKGVRRPRNGFFLRAESYFNVATEIERLDAEPSSVPPIINSYGGRSLHEQSHGESFIALAMHRFGPEGIYILDEPEAALSPQRQLTLLARMLDLVEHQGSQFVIATHSPILMAYPQALIYSLSPTGIRQVDYEDTEHFQITRDFLSNPGSFFKHLFAPDR